jgi:NADH/NAD ratio-sensing transcriptional regulator Rex
MTSLRPFTALLRTAQAMVEFLVAMVVSMIFLFAVLHYARHKSVQVQSFVLMKTIARTGN